MRLLYALFALSLYLLINSFSINGKIHHGHHGQLKKGSSTIPLSRYPLTINRLNRIIDKYSSYEHSLESMKIFDQIKQQKTPYEVSRYIKKIKK